MTDHYFKKSVYHVQYFAVSLSSGPKLLALLRSWDKTELTLGQPQTRAMTIPALGMTKRPPLHGTMPRGSPALCPTAQNPGTGTESDIKMLPVYNLLPKISGKIWNKYCTFNKSKTPLAVRGIYFMNH